MKKIIGKRNNEAAVHLHPGVHHTWSQRSMSTLCPFCICYCLQLGTVRFHNNKGVRKNLFQSSSPEYSKNVSKSKTMKVASELRKKCPQIESHILMWQKIPKQERNPERERERERERESEWNLCKNIQRKQTLRYYRRK
jgi:hypothetical protein